MSQSLFKIKLSFTKKFAQIIFSQKNIVTSDLNIANKSFSLFLFFFFANFNIRLICKSAL